MGQPRPRPSKPRAGRAASRSVRRVLHAQGLAGREAAARRAGRERVQVGQRLVIEGRLRMNTVPRQDGTKEKKAEFTLSRLHSVGAAGSSQGQPPTAARTAPARPVPAQPPQSSESPSKPAALEQESAAQWNTSPLVPETDDIPF